MDKKYEFKNIESFFGENVFSDKVMKELLKKDSYDKFQEVLSSGREMEKDLAEEIANAMKCWAIEKGATHYTHWFQPLTGTTAEKHDSFINIDGSGKLILDFSEKQLIKGEADASSFPSGGTRATFEARGYTIWDCTSPAFVRETKGGSCVLCIPTAFCSYNGEALDKKTPLLRAMEALNKQSIRVLKALGNTTSKKVHTNLGAEQEYFLIKKEHYNKRKDLIFTGRTLFGCPPPKGQELHDQYYASIRDCVSSYMNELNYELWKLGITAKTQHNEAAPSQHELAPVYGTTNIATDHNQLIMEIMKRVADKNGLACILHEKPFQGVNGSGKHNNWSICTDDGINLLQPGKNPKQDVVFLTFFTSIISAVYEYQELLRMSAAHAGNDLRLGGDEAPPAIISVFVGDKFEQILQEIANNDLQGTTTKQYLNLGFSTSPKLKKDTSDRNRTSPFAFTGNKFEFRMVGSSQSTATPNVIICAIVADVLMRVADELEKAKNKKETAYSIIRENILRSSKILYNGNNYSEEWRNEAEKRNLKNIDNAVDAFACLTDKSTVDLFERHSILSFVELKSRQEIYYENYSKTIDIEAKTMIAMAYGDIIPSTNKYIKKLCSVAEKTEYNAVQKSMIKRLSSFLDKFYNLLIKTEESLLKIQNKKQENVEKACSYRDVIVPQTKELRVYADEIEKLTAKNCLPYPNYADLLFYD